MNRDRTIIKSFLVERDGDICGICGKPLDIETASLDHKIPKAKGGTDENTNLQLAHLHCNLVKNQRILTGYIDIEERSENDLASCTVRIAESELEMLKEIARSMKPPRSKTNILRSLIIEEYQRLEATRRKERGETQA